MKGRSNRHPHVKKKTGGGKYHLKCRGGGRCGLEAKITIRCSRAKKQGVKPAVSWYNVVGKTKKKKKRGAFSHRKSLI